MTETATLGEQYEAIAEDKPRKGGRPKGSKNKPKPRSSSSSSSSTKKTPGRPSLWLEKKEAEIISKAIQYGILVRYGTEPELPDKKAQEHLAHVIKRYSDVFPLSFVQGFIRKLMPLHDPNAKPGGSPLGDLAQYAGGWHKENPELYEELLSAHGIYIPFIMAPPLLPAPAAPGPAFRIPSKPEVEKAWGRRISGAEYEQYLREMGVTMHGAEGT